ncbi:hypothetical protein B0O99DRAFT_690083 [Bisporella sp. PMI_857]|nr:hypothetical protein B0O99DRAFT_690083 [Bisporella sp. PMI_857]
MPRVPIEKLITPGVISEVRNALERDWLATKRLEYHMELEKTWTPPYPELYQEMLQLHTKTEKQGKNIFYVNRWMTHLFHNKATVFYWTEAANHSPFVGPTILGGIWNVWHNAIGREPQIHLDEFFAVPVNISPKYSRKIQEILRAHESICAQVQGTSEDEHGVSKLISDQVQDRHDPRYFKFQPLCRALIAVFDEYLFVAAKTHVDGYRHYDDVARAQTILLVRTGYENGLSAPITFDSLKNEALPLARSENLEGIDIIRIPLQVGVRFVANLLLREEAAFPESVVSGSHLSKEADHPNMKWRRDAFEWGEERLASAQERGQIAPFSTAAEVKNVVMENTGLDERPQFYAPYFRPNWV